MGDWWQDVRWKHEKQFVKALALMKMNMRAEWLFYKECVHMWSRGMCVEMCLCFVTSFLELSHLNPSLFLSSRSSRKVEVLKLTLLPLNQDRDSLI